jgi:hypothetical protein
MAQTQSAARLPVHTVSRLWSSPLWRELILLATLLLVSISLRLATYHPIADGGGSRYLKAVIVGGVAALLVWWLVRLQTAPGSLVPLACAGLVLVSGDAIHYVRLLNPITRGAPLLSFSASFDNEAAVRRQWDIETGGGGAVTFESNAVRLTAPPGASAYLKARLPARPDVRQSWWLPLGLAERERVEEITWKATIQRSEGYLVMFEASPLLIQVVPYGIHITYPDAQKNVRGYEIQHPLGRDAQAHEWRLRRDSRQISLAIDGRQVWSGPQHGEINQIRLGETKRDAEHGGTIRLEAASYVTRLEVP